MMSFILLLTVGIAAIASRLTFVIAPARSDFMLLSLDAVITTSSNNSELSFKETFNT